MRLHLIQNPSQLRFRQVISESDIIIDALFGTGIRTRLEEPFVSIVRSINASDKDVVSIDVPSGVEATTGRLCQEAVKAKLTVCLGYLKTGLLKGKGRQQGGRLVVGDISLPN